MINKLHKKLLKKNPELREGQAYFNALAELHPTLADSIRGTAFDPFHDCSIVSPLRTALKGKDLSRTIYFKGNWYFSEETPEYHKYDGIHCDMDRAWFDAQRSDLGIHIEYQDKAMTGTQIIDNEDWISDVLNGIGYDHLPQGIEQETLEFLKILRKEKWV